MDMFSPILAGTCHCHYEDKALGMVLDLEQCGFSLGNLGKGTALVAVWSVCLRGLCGALVPRSICLRFGLIRWLNLQI